jgi:transposase
MASITYHRKPNGATYVYRQESFWDKFKKRPSSRQVCLGKLGDDGQMIYNRRFAKPEVREALERGEVAAESLLWGQPLLLRRAGEATGLERVLRDSFAEREADVLLSLSWAVAVGRSQMYLASVWIEQSECPAHEVAPSSQDISRILGGISQSQVEGFLSRWARHRGKAAREQYCYDLTSVSSYCTRNPFVERGHNRDGEDLAQINVALLTGVVSGMPTYYETHPGSMADTKTLTSFIARMRGYGAGRIRMLLDRGFYSAANINCLLKAHAGFYIPVPSTVGWQGTLIDKCRDAVEMPEHIIRFSEDGASAVYGMTVLDKMAGKRVWKHVYYDTARRSEHIASLFESLATWERELESGDVREANEWAYERYFTVKTTPKRGRRVRRDQEAINAYKSDRAGYWVILTNCEKDAAAALAAYRERTLVEQQFDDMKNDLAMARLRTHGPDTLRGRVLVQFLALVLTAWIRAGLNHAWERRMNASVADRLARRYSLAELMMRLETYRKTSFSGRCGTVSSAPTKAQKTIFKAFGIEVPN